jgi:pimeloyl-ACP methyl ester carboxylesterase
VSKPRLIETRTPAEPEGVVLLLHGGAGGRGLMAVSPTQLSVLRMVPIAQRIAREGRGRLAVFRLLNSARGWDTRHPPVLDVAWALEQVRDRYGDRPVGLVGHSLGGRAALLAGDRTGVRTIVALNPWVYPDDHADLRGRRTLVVHGLADRIASAERSAVVARRLAARAPVGFIAIPDGKHAMLRHGSLFESYASEFVQVTMLGAEPTSPAVAAALAGDFVVGD